MNNTNQAAKEKKSQKKITPVLIGNRANMNELQASIAKCSVAGNVVYLPPISEPFENYQDVRKALINAGGSYKNCSFIFNSDAAPFIERLMSGESVNIKKEFQFFATPKELAEEMAAFAMADFDCRTMTILEPSAGQGALIKACFEHDFKDELIVHAYELMPENRAIVEKIKDVVVLGSDFMEVVPCRSHSFDRIIANPPFSKNQDIDHIRHMYEVCKKGGRIVTIASKHWQFASGKKETDFKAWLNEINAVVDDIEAGTFAESGTKISTCMIIIDKN